MDLLLQDLGAAYAAKADIQALNALFAAGTTPGTGNLDPDLSLEIMNLLREVNARGTTVLVATHDRELIRRVGRRALTLDHGRIVEVSG